MNMVVVYSVKSLCENTLIRENNGHFFVKTLPSYPSPLSLLSLTRGVDSLKRKKCEKTRESGGDLINRNFPYKNL